MAAQLPFFRVYPQQKADFVLKKRPIELGAFPGWIVCLDHKNIRVCIREIKTPGLSNWDRLWPKWGAPDLFSCWLQVRVLTSCQKQKILTHCIIICDVTTSTPDWKVLNCLICAATASTAETQKSWTFNIWDRIQVFQEQIFGINFYSKESFHSQPVGQEMKWRSLHSWAANEIKDCFKLKSSENAQLEMAFCKRW